LGRSTKDVVLQDKADRFAANILPVIYGPQVQGITSHKALARALNARVIRTADNRQWYSTTVKNLLDRPVIR
jgi:hypothetical protein